MNRKIKPHEYKGKQIIEICKIPIFHRIDKAILLNKRNYPIQDNWRFL